MKSYILAIAFAMFISALYAFQNVGDVSVRFLIFEKVFPQGVWEVLLFCSGAILMWIFSIFSQMESRGKYKKLLKEKDEKIAVAEKEKSALLESISASKQYGRVEEPAVAATPEQEAPEAESE
jgi:putative membrane protein